MEKLSVTSVQQTLLEAEALKKAKYEQTKKPSLRPGKFGKWSDHSTQITKIEQVSAHGLQDQKDNKGKPGILQADFASEYADKMEHKGVFTAVSKNQKGPSTPSAEKLTPNQKPAQKKVEPDMKNTKEGQNKKTFWPQADFAQTYVDDLDVGNIYSEDTHGEGVKAPKAKDLGGTTRPSWKQAKKPDLDRWPHKDVTGPNVTGDFQSGPKDAGAPKKPSWEKVKSGVLVRVNETVKVRFGIVNEAVLARVVNNYRRFGYDVVVEGTHDVAWKRDKQFLTLTMNAVSAKTNHLPESYKQFRTAALKRLHSLVQKDYNSMYESRGAFLNTVMNAYVQIEKVAEDKFRDSLKLFEGKVRVHLKEGISDVELLSEATDEQMALRLIRHKVLEHFGLSTRIEHIFVDGKRFTPRQIKEWTPGRAIRNTLGAAGIAGSMMAGGAAHADPQLSRAQYDQAANDELDKEAMFGGSRYNDQAAADEMEKEAKFGGSRYPTPNQVQPRPLGPAPQARPLGPAPQARSLGPAPIKRELNDFEM